MKTNERASERAKKKHANEPQQPAREYTTKNRLLLTTYSISTVADALDKARTLTKMQKVTAIVDSQERRSKSQNTSADRYWPKIEYVAMRKCSVMYRICANLFKRLSSGLPSQSLLLVAVSLVREIMHIKCEQRWQQRGGGGGDDERQLTDTTEPSNQGWKSKHALRIICQIHT